MLIRWLAPALAIGALILFLMAPAANGPLLVLVWTVVILGFRTLAGILRAPAERLAVDGVLFVVCLVAGFEGGWFLLPAVVAYSVLDARSSRGEYRHGPRWHVVLALASAAWGWGVLAVVVNSRLQHVGVTTSPGNVSGFSGTAADLAAGGLRDGRFDMVVAVTALLLGGVLLGSLLRQAMVGRLPLYLMTFATVGVLAVAVAASLSIGPYLLPSVVLALLALWATRRSSDAGRHSAGRASGAGYQEGWVRPYQQPGEVDLR